MDVSLHTLQSTENNFSDYEFDPLDLLSVSHVSKFWRSLALEDKRWDAWFDVGAFLPSSTIF
jgi:hypothetical protein